MVESLNTLINGLSSVRTHMTLKINGSWLYCVEQIAILIVCYKICYLTIHLCYLRKENKKIKKLKNFSADQRSRWSHVLDLIQRCINGYCVSVEILKCKYRSYTIRRRYCNSNSNCRKRKKKKKTLRHVLTRSSKRMITALATLCI